MEHKKAHQLNQLMRSIIYFLNDSLLYDDRLVLRHQSLHDAPAYQVGHCTYTEDDEISGRLALESKKYHLCLVGIVEQQTGTHVDKE